MPRRNRAHTDLVSDPFAERVDKVRRQCLHALGGRFQFESNSSRLLQIAQSAYGGLPRHALSSVAPTFRIGLMLHPSERSGKPPAARMGSGGGFLFGATGSSTCVVISPEERGALIVVPREMLAFPYHTRYELIEFTVCTLAARVQELVPLHAACVGSGGRGILIIGPGGAGKSTLALHALLDGLEFLAEDSVFVAPETLLATGTAAFVHVRASSLRFLSRRRDAEMIRRSPVIRRRSGVVKFEVDLRSGRFRLAPAPLSVAAVVLLSPERAGEGARIRPIGKSRLMKELRDSQPYARQQSGWNAFCSGAASLPAFELRRGRHPRESVEAIKTLLSSCIGAG